VKEEPEPEEKSSAVAAYVTSLLLMNIDCGMEKIFRTVIIITYAQL